MDRIIVGYVFIVIFGVFGIFIDCFANEQNYRQLGNDAAKNGTAVQNTARYNINWSQTTIEWAKAGETSQEKINSASDDNSIVTITSEMVPGADCVCIKDGIPWAINVACPDSVTERKYQCTTMKGLAGFQSVFAQIIRYVINIVLLLGVLAVTGLGIVWSFAGGDDVKMKSTLKTWAINIVVWLIILFMFRYILMFLAPWIYM